MFLLYRVLPFIAIILFTLKPILNDAIWGLIGTLLVLPYLFHYFLSKSINNTVLMFFILTLTGSILNLINTNNGIGGSIIYVGTFTIALFCIDNLKILRYVGDALWLYLIFFLYKSIFVDLVNPNNIFEDFGLSRNYPGYLLVAFGIFSSFSRYYTVQSLPIVMPILSVVIAFFLEGRSSLAIMLVVSILCIFFWSYKKSWSITIASVIFLSMIYFWNDIMFLYSFTRFDTEGTESLRTTLWIDYFNHLDFLNLLFGPNTTKMPIIASFDGNPHNAYLNFYDRMGLLGITSLLVLHIKAIILYIKKRQYIVLSLIVLYGLRLMVDSLLVSTLDFILYTLLFYPILKKNDSMYIQVGSSRNNLIKRILNFL